MRLALSVRTERWTTIQRVALVSFLGQLFFSIPVITPYLLLRDLSLAQINGLQTILIVSQLALEVPTGVIADRFGRRASLIVAAAFQVAAESTFLFAREYPVFVLAQIFAGAGYALVSGSKDALVYDSLPPGDRTEAMQRASGLIGAATQSASVVAYLAGGLIAASLTLDRITITLVLTVVAMVAAFGATFTIPEPAVHTAPEERRSSTALLRDGLRLLRHNAALRRIVLLSLLTNPFGAYLLLLYQAYFLDAGVPGVWFGLALTAGSALAIAAQRYAYLIPRTLGPGRGVLLATALPGALYLIMAVTTQPALAVILFCIQWGATFLVGPLFSGYLNAHIPSGYRATALSLVSLFVSLYLAAMGPLIGWIADRSLAASFTLMGILVLAGALTLRLEEHHVQIVSD